MLFSLRKNFHFQMPLLSKGLHSFARPVFERLGFRLDLRRQGDLKLGLWRKSFRSARRRSIKRFVLIPGLGDSPLTWAPILTQFSSALRNRFDEIVLMDFPGYPGFLSEEQAFHSMDLLSEACVDALNSLRPEVVFGHSLGGWLAATYAVESSRHGRDGDSHQHFVLANPSGLDSKKVTLEDWGQKFYYAKEHGQICGGESVLCKKLPFRNLIFHEYRKFLLKKEIGQFIESVEHRHLLNARLKDLRGKLTLIWGEDDQVNPAVWSEEWEKLLERLDSVQFKKVILESTGHILHLERPIQTARVLSQVIAQSNETR